MGGVRNHQRYRHSNRVCGEPPRRTEPRNSTSNSEHDGYCWMGNHRDLLHGCHPIRDGAGWVNDCVRYAASNISNMGRKPILAVLRDLVSLVLVPELDHPHAVFSKASLVPFKSIVVSRQYRKDYLRNHRAELNAYQRLYRVRNPDKAREWNRRFRTKYPDRARNCVKRWALTHREQIREAERRCWHMNVGNIKEKRKRYRETHPELFRKSASLSRIKYAADIHLRNQHYYATHKAYLNAQCLVYTQSLKREVLSVYSKNLTCQWDGCSWGDIRSLSIDHVLNDGLRHRKQVTGGQGGPVFYNWLKRNGYPKGFQVLCMNHQFIKRQMQLRAQMKDDVHRQNRLRTKIGALRAYSPLLRCQWPQCDCTDLDALSIDHIQGVGAASREAIAGSPMYQWLKNHNYPRGYQVLCMNHQWIKRFENGECRSKR